MPYKKIILPALFLFLISFCYGQKRGESLTTLSFKWKKDNLGQNGFRMHNYKFNTKTKQWLIIGVNLKNYNKAKIIALLGEPNDRAIAIEEGSSVLFYMVQNKANAPITYLYIYLDQYGNFAGIEEKTRE
jgi:hypothetical protein